MQAAYYAKYGGPEMVSVQSVQVPRCGPKDVLVRVHSAAMNRGDYHLLTGEPKFVRVFGHGMTGMFHPVIHVLGSEVSGTVSQVGSKVTDFKPGDEVIGNLGMHKMGSFAEYAVAPAKYFAPKSQALSFTDAAGLAGSALVALGGLRDVAGIKAGDRVLVIGAGGGVGGWAVQIAKALGASRVTAVAGASSIVKLQALPTGADEYIDYTKDDFTKVAGKGGAFNVIFDAAAHRKIDDFKHLLAPQGMYVMAGGSQLGNAMAKSSKLGGQGRKATMAFPKNPNFQADIAYLQGLVESSQMKVPVGEVYNGLDSVPAAFKKMGTGSTGGKLIINVFPN